MPSRFTEWSFALSVAVAVHVIGFAFWYWAPAPTTEPGAAGVSIALAPAVTVSDDLAETQTSETEEPTPIVEEADETPPVEEEVPITPLAEPLVRAPSERPASPFTPPATVAATTNNVSTGSAFAEVGVGDADAKADYIARIADRLARYKRYPDAARNRGYEGVAELTFTVARDGSLIIYEITGTSGYQILDREVEKTLERAQPLPPFPPELNQETMEIIVPVRFELR